MLQGLEPAGTDTKFAAQIERLSEPEGAFDTDNLISNERSYLEVIPALVSAGVSGGAYIGVGPDQNFSYIARIRPAIAYIIDVRRDNLLLHLLFKALFANARSRIGDRQPLDGPGRTPRRDAWIGATVEQITAYIDSAERDSTPARQWRQRLERTIEGFGVPLSPADLDTIGRFHGEFIDAGLSLRFRSHGREPRFYYPTLRELLLATDANGRTWSYTGVGGRFPVRAVARGPRCDCARRRQRERSARDARPCVGHRDTRGARLRLLHLQRGVVSLSRRDVHAFAENLSPPAA